MHDGGQGETWSVKRRILRVILDIVYRPGLEAKRWEWELLKSSDLDWTLVMPPRIAPTKPSGQVAANEKNLAGLQIWVEDLADFILESSLTQKSGSSGLHWLPQVEVYKLWARG